MIILGAKGKIELQKLLDYLKEYSNEIQIMDATRICGKEHIHVAYEHAKRAFEEGTNTCKNIAMELLLYASCKRQIEDAIDFIGAKDNGKYAMVFFKVNIKSARHFIETQIGLTIDNSILKYSMQKLNNFIEKKEFETVEKNLYSDLLFEKIAILNLLK